MTQITHRPTTGQDLARLAKRLLEITEIFASELAHCDRAGYLDGDIPEDEAFLAGDDSGDYLGCAGDAIAALTPWLSHCGPQLEDHQGFSLGDILDLDQAINGFADGLEMGQFDRGFGMATYYADERAYSELSDRADALRDQLANEAPAISEIIDMMGAGC